MNGRERHHIDAGRILAEDAELRRRFYDDPENARLIAESERLVLSNRLSPFTAALRLLHEE